MHRVGVALALVAGLAMGCGAASGDESKNGSMNGAPATSSRPTSATEAPVAAGLTKLQVMQALPDPSAMGAWDLVTRDVVTADGHLNCPSVQQCKGKWFGDIKYRLNTPLTVTFQMTTFGNVADSDGHFQEEKAKYSSYRPIETVKVGDDSLAYVRDAGGLTGAYLTTKVGTVVATVIVERGDYEVTLPQMATMFVQRIRQAQSGRTPDATLPHE